ncbi:MAG: 3-dehydroquinate synthase [Gemmatimonadales bacterium]
MTTIRVGAALPPGRDAGYDVLVGRGILADLPRLLAERCAAHLYAVVTDSRVAELHARRVVELLEQAGLAARLFVFPAGEWNKVRSTWSELCDQLLAAHVGRDGAVVAVGGGVVGDLAGFVAATLHRGIPFVQVPTTTLAMIDASVGGKTGLDVSAGKNLVGAFHPPRFVLSDIDTLATLPRNQIAAGLAEAIKHGVIADAAYAEAVSRAAAACLTRSPEILESIVTRGIAIKAEIVAADAAERGLRQTLNFGHTIAHAVEARSGYGLLHGEAVAIGMAAEAWLAETLGIACAGTRQAVLDLLAAFDLPCTIPAELASDQLVETMLHDKKVRAGAVRFALPAAIGRMAQSADGAWTVDVTREQIVRAIEANR